MVIDMSLMVKDIAMNILCELDVAEDYMDGVFKWKDEDAELAETYYEIATDEIDHINNLHKQVTRIIEESRKDSKIDKDILKIMMSIWNFQHEIIMERVSRLKVKMRLYEDTK